MNVKVSATENAVVSNVDEDAEVGERADLLVRLKNGVQQAEREPYRVRMARAYISSVKPRISVYPKWPE